MKQQIFGLRKAHIDKLLRQMNMDFSSETTPLESDLEKLKAENQKLEREIKEVTEENLNQINENELWSLGQERIERVVNYLEDQQAIEMEEIRKKFSEKANRINLQIKEIDRKIQQKEKLLSDLIEQINYRIDNPESNFKLVEVTNNEEKNVKIDDNLFLSSVEVAASKEMIKDESAPTIIDNENTVKTDQVHHVDETLQNDQPTNSNSKNIWGEVEEWANFSFALQDNETSPSDSFIQIDEEFGEKVIRNKELSSQPVELEKEFINHSYGNTKDMDLSESVTNIHNEELLEQIDSIKTQYIVGKLAGEDLHDIHGNLIIAKNSVITREAVEKANRIGKLADLIVNMKISGPGVD